MKDAHSDQLVRSAGTIPVRMWEGKLQVALVHRPHLHDWTWAKGKLDAGETWGMAAVRETREEAGLHVRLGLPLPSSHYEIKAKGKKVPKEVRYWVGHVESDDFALEHEIDDVRWCTLKEADQLLTYELDHRQLAGITELHRQGRLLTWPLVVVRHAKAESRSDWEDEDALRPLSKRGHREASELVGVLGSYGVQRALTSPATRCTQTVTPWATECDVPVWPIPALSEEMYAAHPEQMPEVIATAVQYRSGTVVCSHGPLLASLLRTLCTHLTCTEQAKKVIAHSVEEGLIKGEAWVAHLTYDQQPTLVTVESHCP